MKIPLANRLKKRLHVDTALLQDELVDILYSLEENAVLHGGTAIWRCYDGNRFSEDLDFYFIPAENFESLLEKKLKERSLVLSKYRKTENIIFSKISNGSMEVRLEVNMQSKKRMSIIRPYEKIDGSFVDIFTLSANDLFLEKIHAYSTRTLIRDIYDIYHLSRYVGDDKKLKEALSNLFSNIRKPLDEENLKTLVYTGAVPSFNNIIITLRSRFSI